MNYLTNIMLSKTEIMFKSQKIPTASFLYINFKNKTKPKS